MNRVRQNRIGIKVEPEGEGSDKKEEVKTSAEEKFLDYMQKSPAERLRDKILKALGIRNRGVRVVSCPSCGRAQVDVYTLAEDVTKGLEGMTVPLRVAVIAACPFPLARGTPVRVLPSRGSKQTMRPLPRASSPSTGHSCIS